MLSLKNQLLLSYIHHLVAVFSLKLTSTSLTSTEGVDVVNSLVKLRVVLEKISPLEGKLKYQIEKLVRKADQAAEGADEDDVANGQWREKAVPSHEIGLADPVSRLVDPLAFRPNPSALMMDSRGSDSGGSDSEGEKAGKSGVYRPPRVAAMPYTEAAPKGQYEVRYVRSVLR